MEILSHALIKQGGRKNIEDAICPKQPSQTSVFVVCDGVGGSNYGEIASEVAANCFQKLLHQSKKTNKESKFTTLIHKSLVNFKDEIEKFVEENPSANGTSTTLTLVSFGKNEAQIAWCGDSRIYQIRNGKIIYKSKDHSLVQEMIDQGILNEQEALNHPKKNVITRSLNQQTKPSDITTAQIKIKTGDWILQCTDGLLEQVTEKHLEEFLTSYKDGFDYSDYFNKICEGKTGDNYSMYLHYVKKGGGASFVWIFGLILFILGLAIGGWYYVNDEDTGSTGDTHTPLLQIQGSKTDSTSKKSTSK